MVSNPIIPKKKLFFFLKLYNLSHKEKKKKRRLKDLKKSHIQIICTIFSKKIKNYTQSIYA